jgi:hypothetical protein
MLRLMIAIPAALAAFSNVSVADSFTKDHPVGSVYEHAVKLPYTTVPLPPGRWEVISSDERENNIQKTVGEMMLVRVEQNKIYGYVYIAGNADLSRAGWALDNFCQRNDIHLAIVEAYSEKDERCWIVNHIVMTRGNDISHTFAAIYSYPEQHHLTLPGTMISVAMRWHDSSTYEKVIYYFNPEFDGISPAQQLEWRTNDWHRDRIVSFPDKQVYIEKLKTWGQEEYKLFVLGVHNKLPSPSETLSAANGSDSSDKSTQTAQVRLKNLKNLFDTGLISQSEYEAKRSDILNGL